MEKIYILKRNRKEEPKNIINFKKGTLLDVFLIFSKETCNNLYYLFHLIDTNEPWNKYLKNSLDEEYSVTKNVFNKNVSKTFYAKDLKMQLEERLISDFILLINKSFENFVTDLAFLEPTTSDKEKFRICNSNFKVMTKKINNSLFFAGLENTKFFKAMIKLRNESIYTDKKTNLSSELLGTDKKLIDNENLLSINSPWELVDLLLPVLISFLEY
ncbi:MAG: hypothetical protein HRS57_03155, partial [Mycoplasmataceae bacterium]|nr:hypothetical protein [Mycoplasmataceae bacterium]